MNGLLLFLFIVTVAVACFFIGERIGYLRGRAKMAQEPIALTISCPKSIDSEAIEKEMRACGRMT